MPTLSGYQTVTARMQEQDKAMGGTAETVSNGGKRQYGKSWHVKSRGKNEYWVSI